MNDSAEEYVDDDPAEQGGDDDAAVETHIDDPATIPPDEGDPGDHSVEGQEDPGNFEGVPGDPDIPTEKDEA